MGSEIGFRVRVRVRFTVVVSGRVKVTVRMKC